MIVGIDPGTAIVGFAFVEKEIKNPKIIDYGVITTQQLPADQIQLRLHEIGQDLGQLLDKHKPNKAVVEDLFFFKNQKTIISVAMSRGVILYELTRRGIPIVNLTPLQLKQQLCGYGRATKDQIQEVVKKVYNLEQIPKPDDAADALALAWLGLN